MVRVKDSGWAIVAPMLSWLTLGHPSGREATLMRSISIAKTWERILGRGKESVLEVISSGDIYREVVVA